MEILELPDVEAEAESRAGELVEQEIDLIAFELWREASRPDHVEGTE
jgi:hypothetical protein